MRTRIIQRLKTGLSLWGGASGIAYSSLCIQIAAIESASSARGERNAPKEVTKKKANASKPRNKSDDTMRSEYRFRGGTRGTYAKKFAEGAKLVSLDPDVAKIFAGSREVNEALRALSKIARRAAG